MKKIKLCVAIMAAVLLGFGFSTTALAFHAGGVAHCDGCHTMHNSQGGVDNIADENTTGLPGDFLTKGSDPSSTCLNCHAGSGSYHVFSNNGGAINQSPGGDFYWLTKTFTWTVRGNQVNRYGYEFGHSIIANDWGLTTVDPVTPAPGGNFPSAQLSCTSCHNPHGKKNQTEDKPIRASGSYGAVADADTDVGNYRLLGDVGYQPTGANSPFLNAPPIARAPNSYNQERDTSHADYGRGMSEWCSNCHSGFVAPGGLGQHKHPASNTSRLGGTLSSNYNSYVKTGDFTGNDQSSYLALVPFERQQTDVTQLDPTSTAGPNGSSTVMCLSCHRAHVSAFPSAGRWDFETEFLAESHPDGSTDGSTPTEKLASYYNRDIDNVFGEYQRSLCNKCHVQD